MIHLHNCKVPVLVAVMLSAAAGVRAQNIPREPDPTIVRTRFGPLWLNPTVALTNAGIDTNVYYEADSDTPERDFTLTMTPQTDYYLRMGRAWVLGNVREDLVWYKDFASERSINGNYTVGLLVPLNRISFNVSGNWVHARERPGFEIDARSQRFERAASGALELRALSKTYFGIRGEQRKIEFDQDEVFLGSNLHDELNRTATTAGFAVRHQLTPLTSISFDVAQIQDRFAFSPDRDSDSTQLGATVSFDPFALIRGSTRIGYRDFKPLSSDVPEYTGLTALVDLSYVALGATRFSVQAMRDIQYSFELDRPYYLQTGFTLSIAQQVFGPIDVEGRLGRQRLSYRQRQSVTTLDRVDNVRSVGGGIGYRLGPDLRLGFNLDRQERTSDVTRRSYEDWRFGFAVTYGL